MDVDIPPSAASQGDELGPSLLALMESLSPSEVEEKATYLLENAKKVLVTPGSTHEDKLDCICLMVDKLMRFVPVFELEDSMLCPLLEAVLEYLDEVLNMMLETEEEGRVVFFSLIGTLMESSEKVVRHCMDQECGVGEVPSLPRVLPKILYSTFSYLGMGDTIGSTEQLKAQVSNCFSKVRDLLILFLTLMEKIKMRTVLEDELDILLELCLELVNFHEILIPLDFKLTCMVWRVYVILITTHQARMVDRFNFSQAPEVISKELHHQIVQLKQMLRNTKDEGTGKVIAKVSYLMKLLISLQVTPSCLGENPSFLHLLLEMMAGIPPFPPWITEPQRQKIEGEIMSVSVKHNLLNMAATPTFRDFLLSFLTPNQEVRDMLLVSPFPSLEIAVHLLLHRSGQEDQLFLLCFHLLSLSTSLFELGGRLEGRQVMGKQVTMVDRYTWVLTNLCSWVSTITLSEFHKVENILISILLDSSFSLTAGMMVSDIWCFMARYGTSQLCLAHLTFLSEIVQRVKVGIFSIPVIMISMLMKRLTNFLSPGDLSTWNSRNQVPELDQLPSLSFTESVLCLLTPRQDQEKLGGVVMDIWRKLVEGSYRPAGRSWSSKLIMALTDTTLMVIDILSTEDLAILLEDILSVVMMGEFKQFLVVCLLKIVRVVARRQDFLLNKQLFETTMSIIRKCECSHGESCVGVLVNMSLGEVQIDSEEGARWVIKEGEELDKGEIETVIGVSWESKDGAMMEQMLNCVMEKEEEDLVMRKVSASSLSSLSPTIKKRKFSPDKDDLERCLDKLERDVDDLASMMELEEMAGKKEKVEKVWRKLQDILHNI